MQRMRSAAMVIHWWPSSLWESSNASDFRVDNPRNLFHFLLDWRLRRMEYDGTRHVARGHMEISEPVLLILLSLAEQPRHGYAIRQDTERMSEGRVRLSTGTLYGVLRRLLEEKWIERFEERDSSRGRQAYRLTAAGRRNLQTEVARMKQLTRVAAPRVARKGA